MRASSLLQSAERPRPPQAAREVARSTNSAERGRTSHSFAQVGVLASDGWAVRQDGVPLIAGPEEAEGDIAIDANGGGATGGGATACPTRIRVVGLVRPTLDAGNVTAGFRTGWGGFAKMEVADESGRDFAGTSVHENLAPEANTCQPGTSACPNTQGQGGTGGSVFTVGSGLNAFGLSLAGERNRFYDAHLFGMQGSLLHQTGLTTCEHRCSQRFDCGGQRFGPEFVIHRTMRQDRLTVGGSPVDITRVDLDKPERQPGDYPPRILPPGTEYA
jgi:hypothetical protein